MSIVFSDSNKREDYSLGNNLLMTIVSGVLLYITSVEMRQFDWLSTSLYFDSRGFNLVGTGTRVILDRAVSEESFFMNLTVWLSSIVFFYAAYLSGPVIGVSSSIFWTGGPLKNWEKRLDWINWKTVTLFSIGMGLAITDSQLDFLWKIGTGTSSVFQAFLVSYVFYGGLSEFAIAISLKVVTVSFGRALGAVGFWQIGLLNTFGFSAWAYENGLTNRKPPTKKSRVKKTSKATSKAAPRRDPPPTTRTSPASSRRTSMATSAVSPMGGSNDLPHIHSRSNGGVARGAQQDRMRMQTAMNLISSSDEEF